MDGVRTMLEYEDGKSYAQLTYDEHYYMGFMEGTTGGLISLALYKEKKNRKSFQESLSELMEEYDSMDMIYEIRAFHEKYPHLNKEQLRLRLIKESELKFL